MCLPGWLAGGHHAVNVLECVFQGFGVIAPIVVIYPLDEISVTPCFEDFVAGGMFVGGILLLAVALTVILAVTCHVEEAL